MEFFIGLNGFDYLLLAIVGLSLLLGIKRGFVTELVALFIWIAAFFLSLYFSSDVASHLSFVSSDPQTASLVGFILIMIAAIIIGAIVNFIVSAASRGDGKGVIDRLIGAVLGLCRGAVMCFVIVFILMQTNWVGANWFNESRYAPMLANIASYVDKDLVDQKKNGKKKTSSAAWSQIFGKS